VREASAVVIAGRCDKDLGFVHQPPEAFGVNDAIAIALEGGAKVGGCFRLRACCAAAANRERRQSAILIIFEPGANGGFAGNRHDARSS